MLIDQRGTCPWHNSSVKVMQKVIVRFKRWAPAAAVVPLAVPAAVTAIFLNLHVELSSYFYVRDQARPLYIVAITKRSRIGREMRCNGLIIIILWGNRIDTWKTWATTAVAITFFRHLLFLYKWPLRKSYAAVLCWGKRCLERTSSITKKLNGTMTSATNINRSYLAIFFNEMLIPY